MTGLQEALERRTGRKHKARNVVCKDRECVREGGKEKEGGEERNARVNWRPYE